MKRYIPFIFPAAAVLVVLFLMYRWYSHNTTGVGQISDFAEGVAIEELTENEQNQVVRGVGDFSTVTLEAVSAQEGAEASAAAAVSGQIRYEIVDGRVRFSVLGQLPELTSGVYQVWLKATDSDAVRKAFVLEAGKGGFMGSAAISADTLPFVVIVSRESGIIGETPTDILMQGTIEAEAAQE